MSGHTREPWIVGDGPQGSFAIRDKCFDRVLCSRAPWPGRADESRANARRICLAVNACASLSDSALESGVIETARQAIEGLLAEWDKLTRYGSPMAKAANERIAFARTALALLEAKQP